MAHLRNIAVHAFDVISDLFHQSFKRLIRRDLVQASVIDPDPALSEDTRAIPCSTTEADVLLDRAVCRPK